MTTTCLGGCVFQPAGQTLSTPPWGPGGPATIPVTPPFYPFTVVVRPDNFNIVQLPTPTNPNGPVTIIPASPWPPHPGWPGPAAGPASAPLAASAHSEPEPRARR